MLGPSGKLLTANLFFEHDPAVLLVTFGFSLEWFLDRNAANLCNPSACVGILLCWAPQWVRCSFVRITVPAPSIITAYSLKLLLYGLFEFAWTHFSDLHRLYPPTIFQLSLLVLVLVIFAVVVIVRRNA